MLADNGLDRPLLQMVDEHCVSVDERTSSRCSQFVCFEFYLTHESFGFRFYLVLMYFYCNDIYFELSKTYIFYFL